MTTVHHHVTAPAASDPVQLSCALRSEQGERSSYMKNNMLEV